MGKQKAETKMNLMRTHVKALGILHVVFGAVGLVLGVGAVALFGGVAGLLNVDNDSNPALGVPTLTLAGGLVLIIAIALSLPGLIGGVGLLLYQPWARTVTIVVSLLELMNIPFGTALGVYGLWVLSKKEGSRLFERQRVTSSLANK
jgi:hypothetical protein